MRYPGIKKQLLVLVAFLSLALPAVPTWAAVPDEARPDRIFSEIKTARPSAVRHLDGTRMEEIRDHLDAAGHHRELIRAQLSGEWVALLTSTEPGSKHKIEERFKSWIAFWEFLRDREALVEVWTHRAVREGSGEWRIEPRRLTAMELGELHASGEEPPTHVTARFRENSSSAPRTFGLEFSFHAAERAVTELAAYHRDRELRLRLHGILGRRDENGRQDAREQWAALDQAVRAEQLRVVEMPAKPATAGELLLGFEARVDEQGQIVEVVRFFREANIHRETTGGRVRLRLDSGGNKNASVARAFRVRSGSDRLEPVETPMAGQDDIELRVEKSSEPDPAKWNRLEFGAPEVLKQSGLARIGLINAMLERHRKQIALRKSNLDIYAEPVIAALNIGAGAAGVGFPVGEAARLAYNLGVTSRFVPQVPTSGEMRKLFLLLAARKTDPQLKLKPVELLEEADLKRLQERSAQLSEAESEAVLSSLSDEDMKAMLSLSRWQNLDQKYRLFVDVLSSAARVSGEADTGLMRDIFNSPYFSLNGEVSLKNSLAAVLGEKMIIQGRGPSLEDLVKGRGPAKAWLQFFDVSVDFRAVLNTMARWSRKTREAKELQQPFGHAPRLNDLAAYEVRIFGYPLFMYYKRGLLKNDIEAYDNDYAYALNGSKIVKHFPTRESMEAEIRSGRMQPLGYVKVRDAAGKLRDSNLMVFAWQMEESGEEGRSAIVIYGMKAYQDYSSVIQGQHERFNAYVRGLEEGAVIERVVGWEKEPPAREVLTAKIHTGPELEKSEYQFLLGSLSELRRFALMESWGGKLDGIEEQERTRIREALKARRLAPPTVEDERRLAVDRFQSTFIHRVVRDGQWVEVQRTLIPGMRSVEKALQVAGQRAETGRVRKGAFGGEGGGDSAILYFHQAVPDESGWRMGPALMGTDGRVLGTGLIAGRGAAAELGRILADLSPVRRAKFLGRMEPVLLLENQTVGGRKVERLFLAVEFPSRGRFEVEQKNPLTGEPELWSFDGGRNTRRVGRESIVEFQQDADGLEAASSTWRNLGTMESPVRGELLEETLALEHWVRSGRSSSFSDASPMVSKLVHSRVTGGLSRRTYGLFHEPLSIVDERYVTSNRFNAGGWVAEAVLFANGRSEADFARPVREKLMEPLPGKQRMKLVRSPLDGAGESRPGEIFEVEDPFQKLRRTRFFDAKHSGRLAGELVRDTLQDGREVSISVTNHYKADFAGGQIPFQALTLDTSSGVVLSKFEGISFDPGERRLVGVESDYRGRTTTNTWSGSGTRPAQIEMGGRRTELQYDFWQERVQGRVVQVDDASEVSRFEGRQDPGTGEWFQTETLWFAAGVTNRVERSRYSRGGRLLSVRSGDVFEMRPEYDAAGRVIRNTVLARATNSSAFDRVQRVESDFKWSGGAEEAAVELYADGRLLDSFRRINDPLGRTVTNGIRAFPGLRMETRLEYDGNSGRVTESRDYLNGTLRTVRSSGTAPVQWGGTQALQVVSRPVNGVVSTQYWAFGSASPRPLATLMENGDRVEVREWVGLTDRPRVSEVIDRRGRRVERFTGELNTGMFEGIPVDRVSRQRLSPWGQPGAPVLQTLARGSDVLLAQDTAGIRTIFNWGGGGGGEEPLYAMDAENGGGVRIELGGVVRTQVTSIFRRLAGTEAPAPRSIQDGAGIRWEEEIDLRPLFSHPVIRRARDRSGRTLEEHSGRLLREGGALTNAAALFERARTVSIDRVTVNRFEAGQVIESGTEAGRNRALSFGTNRVVSGAGGYLVNEGGSREWVSGVEVFEVRSTPAGLATNLVQRWQEPRWQERNPYQPDQTQPVMAWDQLDLDSRGGTIVRNEVLLDSQGVVRTARSFKSGGGGMEGIKTAHLIVLDREREEVIPMQRAIQPAGLGAAGMELQDTAFVYWLLQSSQTLTPELLLRDARGGELVIREEAEAGDQTAAHFWAPNPSLTLWLPDAKSPKAGLSVGRVSPLKPGERLLVVAVDELIRGGVDVSRLTDAAFRFPNARGATWRLSQPHRLLRAGAAVVASTDVRSKRREWQSSGGLIHTQVILGDRSAEEVQRGQGMASIITLNGTPLAMTRTADRDPLYPEVTFLDASGTGVPQPVYTISSREGRFLDHYRTVDVEGATQLYTVVQGFRLPKFEVFSRHLLVDEISPGFMAYGYGYNVTVEYERAGSLLFDPVARLRDRIAANTFKFWGRETLVGVAGDGSPDRFRRRFDYASLHSATNQARTIEAAPMLGQALLSTRSLPWEAGAADGLANVPLDLRALRTALLRLHVRRFGENSTPVQDPTYLIPPVSGIPPQLERYVDTVQEGAVIRLCVALGEVGLAADLLGFYRDKWVNERQPIHSSYDAETGTAMKSEPGLERPMQARHTAEAQIAIAEAALALANRTGSRESFDLAVGLTTNLMTAFRPRSSALAGSNREPRGLTSFESFPVQTVLGFKLWPDPARYSVWANSRALLLLKQLTSSALWGAPSDSSPIRNQLAAALTEQEAWMRIHPLREAERTGVVPDGFFQVQDINQETEAIAPEKWTSAGSWLAFVEAAHALGVPEGRLREWLENLVRVHGVTVGKHRGLDWSIPLLRREAISTELTAGLLRVSRLIGHRESATYAAACLSGSLTNNRLPVVVTEARMDALLKTEQGGTISPRLARDGWPDSYAVFADIVEAGAAPAISRGAPLVLRSEETGSARREYSDLYLFLLITSGFYLSILATALFWWALRWLRRSKAKPSFEEDLIPAPVMQLAEERWATRVLGVQTPAGAGHTRISNAPVEANFLMQLRAIYKLVVEWRRQENGWDENDPRIASDGGDAWLNGLDEYVSMVGIYARFTIKAGAKDGFDRAEVITEQEDSNHIWSRLVMFYAEHYWGMVTLMRNYNNLVLHQQKAEVFGEISHLLESMGLRRREIPFDARQLFNYPANPSAFDLLIVQKPGAVLSKVMLEASMKLRIPYSHILSFIEKYKAFKRREVPYPIHPYLIEYAKVLPHFVLMGLCALIWYNQETLRDSPVVPYLWSLVAGTFQKPETVLWFLPLAASLILSVVAHSVRSYRFEASMLHRDMPQFIFDATLTALMGRKSKAMPDARTGAWWNPDLYERVGWVLRCVGYAGLAYTLFTAVTPSFATFLVVKGILAMLVVMELVAIAGPLAMGFVSKWLQDYVSDHPQCPASVKFLNRLNLTATRPASPLWLSLRYHAQASVPSAGFLGMAKSILFYFGLTGTFFLVGAYLCQQILPLWFTDTYLRGSGWKLLAGGLLFWNTMYLLRYGLFLLATSIASFFATFPLRTMVLGTSLAWMGATWILPADGGEIWRSPAFSMIGGVMLVVLAVFETQILSRMRAVAAGPGDRLQADTAKIAADPNLRLGLVYMSGDDLSALKLNPDLLMGRWQLLRDKFGSRGLALLHQMTGEPDDATLKAWFGELFEAEKRAAVTLWHPSQLVIEGEIPALQAGPDLNITIPDAAARGRLLHAWHIRRWLVTMMSSAGHSQDTAITLVDVALRLQRDGLAARTVLMLIQNKYDDQDNNRPVQLNYRQGELAHRDKYVRLVEALAPGIKAYSIQNWTPFGFKAGGMTGMDLIFEESLRLSHMVVLDRNATVHDLDSLMVDLTRAMTDPNVVIVIPGRGTTNTLTDLGQGSQMIEEGHRSFLKGLISVLGGDASEGVGTGWGNIVAYSYGRVQRAMMDPSMPKMPLTSRMHRGANFAFRTEGLIGFTPHAVGISEDTWAVSQAAHNLAAMGGRVKFQLSTAIWHKIRETWSHAEWLTSFPRWSGGYLQMMQDPLMQRINDFGPLSIFSREIRANSGRVFLGAPLALLNVLLLPLAILFDVTPFVQILIVMWNFGFVMNQVLTLHGLNLYLEGTGFNRVLGVAGAVVAGLGALAIPSLAPYAAGLAGVGAIYGGFFAGLHRWLFTRVRDAVLFGPQLVLHTLGQVMRQTIEFVASGAAASDPQGVNMPFRTWAGPREDRPMMQFPHFLNLRTVVWFVGIPSLVFILMALSSLDMFNVLLLLPSLLFTVSLLAGPFLMQPRPGGFAGAAVFLPKLLAWPAAVGFYVVISMLIARGGVWNWIGALVLGISLHLLLRRSFGYIGFQGRVRRVLKRISSALQSGGVASEAAESLVRGLPDLASDEAKVRSRFEQGSVPSAVIEPALQLVRERLAPLMKEPMASVQTALDRRARHRGEFVRSFLLAIFVLLWFFVVPMPGLFVFEAGAYKTSMLFKEIMFLVLALVGWCVAGYGMVLVLERVQVGAFRRLGLGGRLSSFQSAGLRADGPLHNASAGLALLTEFQTYVDQRGYAYAGQVLEKLETKKVSQSAPDNSRA